MLPTCRSMCAPSPLQIVVVMFAVLMLGSGVAHADPAHVEGQLIVHFDEGANRAVRDAVHRRARGAVAERISAIGAEVVRVADERAALARYNADPAVRLAELDVVARALHDDCSAANQLCLVPSDPSFALQWGLQNDASTVQPAATSPAHDADIDAPYAWRQTTGSASTRIAVLDSGVDLDHEDLATKVVASYNATRSRTLDDKYGHGTAVAGVAAARTDNGVGIAGVGYSSSLMNVKVLDDRGVGSCSTVAKGINWAADNGANVINMSLGFADCTAGRRAVDYAWGKGVVLTAAAGNDGDESATYPAYYPNVMAVAATDNADDKTSFSQFGGWVDIAAPGINVYTTFPNHSNQLGKTNYDYGKGTSMSAPFVAGAAGLLWSVAADDNSNDRVNDEVRARLETYADDIEGTGTLWAAGRLNVCNAVVADACPMP